MQPYPISNTRTALDKEVEPWLLPQDAFPDVTNIRFYRGQMIKSHGYTLYAPFANGIYEIIDTGDGVTTSFPGPYILTETPLFRSMTLEATSTTPELLTANDNANINSTSPYTTPAIASPPNAQFTIDYTTKTITNVIFDDPPANGASIVMYYQYFSGDPIMGVYPYWRADSREETIIFSTRRINKINLGNGLLEDIPFCNSITLDAPDGTILIGAIDGVNDTYTGTLGPVVRGSVHIIGSNPSQTATDDGLGGFTGDVSAGSIDYGTGVYSITFNNPPAAASSITLEWKSFDDIWTGNNTNFFDVANWQNKAWIVNGVDQVKYYDGDCIRNLTVDFTGSGNNEVDGVLHVRAHRERLLLINYRDTSLSPNVRQQNGIRWCRAGNPLIWTNDEFLLAPTSTAIQAVDFINEELVCAFKKGWFTFRYTGDAFQPFRWDRFNSSKECDAPFSNINYESLITVAGREGYIYADGVNAERTDERIPDFMQDEINQKSFSQCYGCKIDSVKEGWLLYPSSKPDSSTKTSNAVLAWNYLDKAWTKYDFAFNVVGPSNTVLNKRWIDIVDSNGKIAWKDFMVQWNSNSLTSEQNTYLAGDNNGYVYQLFNGATRYNPDTQTNDPLLFSLTSATWNPFVDQGLMAVLGWIDFYLNTDVDAKMRVDLYADDEIEPYRTITDVQFYRPDLLFNGTKIMQRIYVGTQARYHRIRLYQTVDDYTNDTLDQSIVINSIVPWFKPGGSII